MEVNILGIECMKCTNQWRIEVPLSLSSIEAYATLCECGSIIVGNIKKSISRDVFGDDYLDQRYLTNGTHIILGDTDEITRKLPLLPLDE